MATDFAACGCDGALIEPWAKLQGSHEIRNASSTCKEAGVIRSTNTAKKLSTPQRYKPTGANRRSWDPRRGRVLYCQGSNYIYMLPGMWYIYIYFDCTYHLLSHSRKPANACERVNMCWGLGDVGDVSILLPRWCWWCEGVVVSINGIKVWLVGRSMDCPLNHLQVGWWMDE